MHPTLSAARCSVCAPKGRDNRGRVVVSPLQGNREMGILTQGGTAADAAALWAAILLPLSGRRSRLTITPDGKRGIDSWGFVRLAANYAPGYGVACLRQAAGMLTRCASTGKASATPTNTPQCAQGSGHFPARAVVLADVLIRFGAVGGFQVLGVPLAALCRSDRRRCPAARLR